MRKSIIILFALLLSSQIVITQEFTIHEFRKVAPEDIEEYIRREVIYWGEFAENEFKKGNFTYWAILQRVGGENLEVEPNFLIINTFKDIDKEVDWASIQNLFPKIKLKDLQTEDLYTTTDKIFLRDLGNSIKGKDVETVNDFKYIRINYHNMKDVWWHLNFESQQVKPFFQKAIDEGKTSIKGWGNSFILTPKSEAFQYKTESHEFFSSLKDALGPNDFPDMDFPEDFFKEWQENYVGARNVRIYKIIKMIRN